MKKYYSFAFMLIVLVSMLLGAQIVRQNEVLSPLGTDTSFTLYLGGANVTREQVISDLERIAASNEITLLKPNTDSETFSEVRNLYYFSPSPPTVGVPSVDESGKLQWLTDSLTGDLLPPTQLGEAPISGTYYVTHTDQLRQELEQWAAETGLVLFYDQPRTSLKQFFILVAQTGLGISFIAVLLLTLALVVTDVLSRTYLRSIQLLNGIPATKINQQQILRVTLWGGLGAGIGVLLSLAYGLIFLPRAIAVNVASSALPYLGIGLLTMVIAAIITALVFGPNVNLIRTRTLPSKSYHRVNLVLQVVAVAICVAATASAVGLGKNAFAAYRQHVSSEILGQAVAVSIKDFDYLDTEEGLAAAEILLKKPEIETSTALSLNVGASIELGARHLGEYDQIALANDIFLDLIDFPRDELLPVEWASLSSGTAEFLGGQLEIWITEGTTVTDTFLLYTLVKNDGYISLDPNVGYGGEINKPTHPLIIVPTKPVSELKIGGFTLPMMSTGNVFFTDPIALKNHIYSSPIAPSIRSIDRIADGGLVAAQYFKAQILSYLSAFAVSFALIAVTAWQSAMIWANSHRKHILIATMSGVAPRTMYRKALNGASRLTSLAAILGAIFSVSASRYTDIFWAMLTAMVMIVVFWLVSAKAYASNTRRTFEATIQRKV